MTAGYLTRSFNFYRLARNQCDALLGGLVDGGRPRIALVGAGELAEIALLCALQHEVEVAGVVDPTLRANRFRHVPLVSELASLGELHAVLLTDLKSPQATYQRLASELEAERILTPALLKVSRGPPGPDAAEPAP